MNKNLLLSLFNLYSYAYNLLFIILEFLPPFIRNILFKIMLNKVGKNVLIDYKVFFRYGASIEIGSNVNINRGCEFFTSFFFKNEKITIGDNTAIGYNTKFYMAQHDYSKLSLPDTAKGISVGSNVWIAGSVIILPGVKIGDCAVIGANSVVTRDIPPYAIAVGNPAKVIKYREIEEIK